MATSQDVLAIYDRIGPLWAQSRSRTLTEKRWLDRMLAYTPLHGRTRRILDLGCGAGRPIGEYLVDRGMTVTGVDGAASMADLYGRVLPKARAIHADMRGLDLGEKFDGILLWDSLFHLTPDDQRAMFPTLAAHLSPRGALMFTSGPTAGTAMGKVGDETVFHASLSPDDYRALLDQSGFDVIDHVAQDATCSQHTIWLARAR